MNAPPGLLPTRKALPFTALLFLLVAAHGLLETARDGLFLTEQPLSRLPWLYLAVTAGVLALTPLQRRLWNRGSRLALPLTLVAAGAVTVAFWIGSGSRAAVLAFYVWTALFSSLVFVQFWLTADEAFQVSEAKHTFGFIAAGGLLGAVAGTGTARLLLVSAHPGVLLLVSAFFTFGAATLAYVIGNRCAGRAPAGPEMAVARVVPGAVREDGYLRLLAVLALLTAASATLIDYLFKAAVAASATPERIPRLVADVYLGQSILALLVELVVVRLLLQSTGVTRSLALLPLVVLAGASGYAVAGGLVVLLLLKILDGGLRPSLYRVGTELLFLPIGSAERRVIKPSIDTLGQRGGQTVASLFLLGVPQLPSRLRIGAVAVGLAALALGWVQATRVLRRQYLRRFQEQLGAGRVEARGIGAIDLSSAEILVAALGSSNSREVLTALDVLAGSDRLGLVPALILHHPDPLVVRTALEHFSHVSRPDVDALLPVMLRHPDDQVRATAARRWVQGGHRAEDLRAALDDPSPRVRLSALLTLSGTDPAHASWETLRQVAAEGDPEARRALAWAIANAPRPDLLPLVETLFEKGDTEVRRELLRAARGLPTPPVELISQLVSLLAKPELRAGARDALATMGPPARVRLEALLLASDTPYAISKEVPPTLARFPPESAARALLERLDQPSGGLDRFRSLRALNQLRRNYPRLALDRTRLGTALEREIRSAFKNRSLRLAGVQLGLGRNPGGPAGTLLLDLLRDKDRRAIERVFRVLDLRFPGNGLEQVYLGARSDRRDRQEAAREVLLELLRSPWREQVLTLLDAEALPSDPAGQLLGPEPTPDSFVAALLGQSSEVVRLLTPCLAHEQGWVTTLPRLRAGPRCADADAAFVAATAIHQLERRAEQPHA
jgi:AAA family ATP:ADP antiporter